MKFWRRMWFTPSVESDKARICRLLKAGKPVKQVFLVVLSDAPGRLIDIYPSDVLKYRFYRRSKEIVIGISGDKGEAEELACGIIAGVYQTAGNFDIGAAIGVTPGKA